MFCYLQHICKCSIQWLLFFRKITIATFEGLIRHVNLKEIWHTYPSSTWIWHVSLVNWVIIHRELDVWTINPQSIQKNNTQKPRELLTNWIINLNKLVFNLNGTQTQKVVYTSCKNKGTLEQMFIHKIYNRNYISSELLVTGEKRTLQFCFWVSMSLQSISTYNFLN